MGVAPIGSLVNAVRQSKGLILPCEKLTEQELTSEETQAGGTASDFEVVGGDGLIGDDETKGESTDKSNDADRIMERGAMAFEVFSESVC